VQVSLLNENINSSTVWKLMTGSNLMQLPIIIVLLYQLFPKAYSPVSHRPKSRQPSAVNSPTHAASSDPTPLPIQLSWDTNEFGWTIHYHFI
jgi:hypothetical protein